MADEQDINGVNFSDESGEGGRNPVHDLGEEFDSTSTADVNPFPQDDAYADFTDPSASGGDTLNENPAGSDDTPDDGSSARTAAPAEDQGGKKSGKKSGNKDKKGKKEKSPKAAAAKTPKKPKVKKTKKEKPASNTDNPVGFYWLWFVLTILFLGVVDALAYKQAGPDSFLFIGVFDGLGLLLLGVPLMLIGGSRKYQYSLYDIFLALAAYFAVLSCLAILTCQVQNYGASAKVASLITDLTTTFYV